MHLSDKYTTPIIFFLRNPYSMEMFRKNEVTRDATDS